MNTIPMLEDPEGAPYPAAVQAYVSNYMPGLDDLGRAALVLALESVAHGEVPDGPWRIMTASDDLPWPCTIVDSRNRSLLGVHNGTPIVRDRPTADFLVEALNKAVKTR